MPCSIVSEMSSSKPKGMWALYLDHRVYDCSKVTLSDLLFSSNPNIYKITCGLPFLKQTKATRTIMNDLIWPKNYI